MTFCNSHDWPANSKDPLLSSNLRAWIENVKDLEDGKYKEHFDALKAGNNGTNSMLHEYNYGVMNPYYTNNVISKWLEEQLRQGDLISDDRVGDLVIREIDKKIEEYNG